MANNLSAPKVSFNNFEIKKVILNHSNIEAINLYESLIYPGITGNITMKDFGDIKQRYNFNPNDTFKLEFNWRGEIISLSDEHYVLTTSKGDELKDDALHNINNFSFETKWSVNAFNKKIIKSFRNKKISEIITHLVEKECGGQMGIVKDTLGVLDRFITPNWTLTEIFKYLMTFAVEDPNNKTNNNDFTNGGYCLWTDLQTNKVNFTPISYLFSGETNYNTEYPTILPSKKYNDISYLESIILEIQTQNEHSLRRLLAINIENDFDVMKYVDAGVTNTTFCGFDFDNLEVMEENIQLNDLKARKEQKLDPSFKQNHLSLGIPIDTKYNNDDYLNFRATLLYPNTDMLITKEDSDIYTTDKLLKGRAYTRTSNLLADIVKINVVTNGDPNAKKVGRQVIIKAPSVDRTKSEKENPRLTGTYVVRNNRHTIIGGYYTNVLTVMACGIKDFGDRTDYIDWAGKNKMSIEESTELVIK